jgi:BON domain-containing protein
MTDKSLEQCVRSAFDWGPSLEASDIGVSVEEGIVRLRGYAGSYAQKVMAEQVALRVYGVRAVANDMDVHVLSGFHRTDTEIAQGVVAALTWDTMVPCDRVTVTIVDGWLTLTGWSTGITKRTPPRAPSGICQASKAWPTTSFSSRSSGVSTWKTRSRRLEARRRNRRTSHPRHGN